MTSNVGDSSGRDSILSALRCEFVGPDPRGVEIDLSEVVRGEFPDGFKLDGPYFERGSGEEILCVEPPGLRYGVGILFPQDAANEFHGQDGMPADPIIETIQSGVAPDESSGEQESTLLERQAKKSLDRIVDSDIGEDPVYGDDFDLSGANTRRPNSMAISFLANLATSNQMVVQVTGGRYERLQVTVPDGGSRDWYVRRTVSDRVVFNPAQLSAQRRTIQGVKSTPLNINIEVHSRPHPSDAHLITVCLVNRTRDGQGNNERSLYQAAFEIVFENSSSHASDQCILPYPKPLRTQPTEEEQSLDLLYREFETFAVGHGCSATWKAAEGGRNAITISAVTLPCVETPSITPTVVRRDGSTVEVPMAPLAGLVDGDDGRQSLEEIVNLYETWILERQSEIGNFDGAHKGAALKHVDLCRRCLERIREGIAFLDSDENADTAFRLANEAIFIQQLRSSRSVRVISVKNGTISFPEAATTADFSRIPHGRGNWRSFQIAFFLMSLRSTVLGLDQDRETVDLIWFPTGGGKTEAYFGLAAFSAFYRRLVDPSDTSVQVIMRYTLRLLTTQQFQRASGLLCAMESIRRREVGSLGEEPYSIGIWVGNAATPNTRLEAKTTLANLRKGNQSTQNKFLLTKCPWCSAQMGQIRSSKISMVAGYEWDGETVKFRCPDSVCEFASGLPIHVVDEDIYDRRPTFVIGTVDKFALLAWQPKARSLFGLDGAGTRVFSPPGLIIQDELHLISGPLGSMVGLYEGVIEDLCTDYREGSSIKPKIVCSTATIRRYEEQARALFARVRTELFPPPGLSATDSFFASYARDSSGFLAPGRVFVGIHAPGLGSIQTAEVRCLSTLLQAPRELPDERRDPWWTLLIFFNSLREIGIAATLFQSDIPDRLRILRRRGGLDPRQIRRLYEVMELTSRLSSDAIPKAIESLEIVAEGAPRPGRYPVDACLASNIIEVGVDIDRLSLLTIVGQPKSTSQYIQVAGRVGRRWSERPGLVVVVLGPNSTRDRSHYEKFRSYHERLYAQVEPTSVTPFSPPVLERALHAAMVAYVRQNGDLGRPLPVPEDKLARLRALLERRVDLIDPSEVDAYREKFDLRLREWRTWQRTEWSRPRSGGDVPLLTQAGSYIPPEDKEFTWPTPQSMRNVDAECRTEVTRSYLIDEGSSNV